MDEVKKEACAYLAKARAARGPEEMASLIWEASGLLEVGVVAVYVPAKFLRENTLTERSVRVGKEYILEVAAHLQRY